MNLMRKHQYLNKTVSVKRSCSLWIPKKWLYSNLIQSSDNEDLNTNQLLKVKQRAKWCLKHLFSHHKTLAHTHGCDRKTQ